MSKRTLREILLGVIQDSGKPVGYYNSLSEKKRHIYEAVDQAEAEIRALYEKPEKRWCVDCFEYTYCHLNGHKPKNPPKVPAKIQALECDAKKKVNEAYQLGYGIGYKIGHNDLNA